MYIKSIANSKVYKDKYKDTHEDNLSLSSNIANFMYDNPNYFTIFSSFQNEEKLKQKYLNGNKYYFDDFLGNIEKESNIQTSDVDKIRNQFIKSNTTNTTNQNNDGKIFITDIKYIIKDSKSQYNENQNILDIIKNHIYCTGPLCISYETTEAQYNLDYYGIKKGNNSTRKIINGIIIGWTKGEGKSSDITISINGPDGRKTTNKTLSFSLQKYF
jgi:hypothetical protein